MEFEAAERKKEQEEEEQERRRPRRGRIPWLFSESVVSKGFTRIINGYDAPHRPWMVQLKVLGEDEETEVGSCGGMADN